MTGNLSIDKKDAGVGSMNHLSKSLTMASVPSIKPPRAPQDTVIRMTDLSQTRVLLRREPPQGRPLIPRVPLIRDIHNIGQPSHVESSTTIGCGSSSDSCSSEIKQIFARGERNHDRYHHSAAAAAATAGKKSHGDDNRKSNRDESAGEKGDKEHKRRHHHHHHREHRASSPRHEVRIEGPRTCTLLIFVLCFLVVFFTVWLGMMMAIVKRLNPSMSY